MHRLLTVTLLLCTIAPAHAATVNASASTVVVAAPGNELRLSCNAEGARWRVTDPPQVAGLTFPGPQLTLPAVDAWQALGGGDLRTAHVVCEAPGFEPQPVTVELLGLSALGGDLIIPQTMLEVEGQQRLVIDSSYANIQAMGVIDPLPLAPGEAYRRFAMGMHMLDDGGESKPSVHSSCTSFLNPSFKCVMPISGLSGAASPYLNTSLGGVDIGAGYSEDVTGDYLIRITASRDPLMPSQAWFDPQKSAWSGERLDNYPGSVHGDTWIHVDGSRTSQSPSAFFRFWEDQLNVNGVTYRQVPGTYAQLPVGLTDLPVRSLLHSYSDPIHGGISTESAADFEQMELLALYQTQGTTLLRTETSGRTVHDRVRLSAEQRGVAVLYAAFRYRKTGEIGHQVISVFVN